MTENLKTSAIVQLSDRLRTKLLGGTVLSSVQSFDDFSSDNDPYGEHDFGAIDLPDAEKIFWKIDYYDLA